MPAPAPFRVRALRQDGLSVIVAELDLEGLGASTNLPFDPMRYFLPSPEAVAIALRDLVVSRARPEGIANAARLMRAAFQGTHPRRSPISVRRLAEGDYLVEDGNSTVLNAVASAWPSLPCIVASDAPSRGIRQ